MLERVVRYETMIKHKLYTVLLMLIMLPSSTSQLALTEAGDVTLTTAERVYAVGRLLENNAANFHEHYSLLGNFEVNGQGAALCPPGTHSISDCRAVSDLFRCVDRMHEVSMVASSNQLHCHTRVGVATPTPNCFVYWERIPGRRFFGGGYHDPHEFDPIVVKTNWWSLKHNVYFQSGIEDKKAANKALMICKKILIQPPNDNNSADKGTDQSNVNDGNGNDNADHGTDQSNGNDGNGNDNADHGTDQSNGNDGNGNDNADHGTDQSNGNDGNGNNNKLLVVIVIVFAAIVTVCASFILYRHLKGGHAATQGNAQTPIRPKPYSGYRETDMDVFLC